MSIENGGDVVLVVRIQPGYAKNSTMAMVDAANLHLGPIEIAQGPATMIRPNI